MFAGLISGKIVSLFGKKDQIYDDSVEFEDGEKIDFARIDFNLIKPLIWW
jgi:hypothetical protein